MLDIIGWNSEPRPTTDTVGWTFVFSGGEKEIPCNGAVIAWNYYASVAAPFRAIVWRRTSTPTQFSVVGINDIAAGPINTAVTYSVPKDQRIEVRKGDLIGLAMKETNAKVPYRNGGADITQTRWLRNNNPDTMQPGDIVDLITGVTDRSWSFSAQVLGTFQNLLSSFLISLGIVHFSLLLFVEQIHCPFAANPTPVYFEVSHAIMTMYLTLLFASLRIWLMIRFSSGKYYVLVTVIKLQYNSSYCFGYLGNNY